ncbi:MAG: CoA pyrophosphatase [Vicinamibacterales bacterium]
MDGVASRLRQVLEAPLPGLDAQLRLAPSPRRGWDPYDVPEGLRAAAALVLVYPSQSGILHLPLTVRGGGLRTHTGQVSLPGGAVDPGETFEMAALREAVEEVGIDQADVEVLGPLTPLHIPVSGFLLHPVVGITPRRPAFRPAEHEVARLLEVPLSRLAHPATVARETRLLRRGGTPEPVDVPYFDVEGEKVWGATAMILAEFLEVARLAGLPRASIW